MVRHWSRRVAAGLLLGLAAACNRRPEAGLAHGRAVYDTCAPCHGVDGAGDRALGAPAVAGLPRWYVQAQLENFMASRRGAHPFDTVGLRMKSMSLALDDAADLPSVAEYVASMAAVPAAPVLTGDAQAGQASYQVCQACHGADGKGNEALHAPPLAGQHDWYLVSQLQKYRQGWRGTDPADVWGATMRANAMALDDAAMLDLAAYIQTLR